MRKSLKDISWDVPEEQYRADPALSYSTLAKYERTGFNGLGQLFDRIETPSLTFGSMVDEMITGSMESFNNRFLVAEFPNVSDSLIQIARTLFSRYSETNTTVSSIADDILAAVGKECDFWANDKYKAHRVKLIKEGCEGYYRLLYLSKDKVLVSNKDYQDACYAVQSLRGSESTKWFFQEDNPFDGIERFYQLKFKATLEDVDYRCMADLIIVDHNNKKIYPCDLKTSSHTEWDFYKSFVDWNYQIQARLYWRIIKDNLEKDEYFRDFTLENYQFIVVNKRTLIPLVWEFESTTKMGELTFGRNNQVVLRDPFTIGEELNKYLEYNYDVPIEIEDTEPNSIEYWLNKI